jgi:hypothetical protein
MSRFLLKKWMTILLSGLFSEANLRVVNSASHCSSISGAHPNLGFGCPPMLQTHCRSRCPTLVWRRTVALSGAHRG